MNDGGHAFPNITPDMIVDGGPGMSLRDWFAGQALTGILANPALVDQLERNNWGWVASRAFGAADAMLAERANNKGRD